MDSSGLGGRFLSGPNGGLLDLESPIHRHQQSQMGHPSFPHQYHQINLMGSLDTDQQPIGLMELKNSTPKGYSPGFGKGKEVNSFDSTDNGNMSEDEEPSFAEDGHCEISNGDRGKKGSPWQRMKWTDNVVRLLIAVVAFADEDGSVEGVEGLKRKSGMLQKKGKWKTVSKIMISKGCHVSPQQCEDKFNDLNKRYKRLNDILGRGTSCKVVENPALMDSLPHLTAKAKDDVRKILSSKHLFYKEMCAYHNGQKIPNCHDIDLREYSLPLERSSKGVNGSGEEEVEGNHDSDDDDDDDDSDDEDDINTDEDGDRALKLRERKKENIEDARIWRPSGGQNSFEIEMATLFQDPTVSSWERKERIMKQSLQLLEQRVSIQAQALELEKQRFKWLRYCSKKDKEFERLRLENERMRLENEQSLLHMRQKQLEMDLRRNAETPFDSTSYGMDRLPGRDQNNTDRNQ